MKRIMIVCMLITVACFINVGCRQTEDESMTNEIALVRMSREDFQRLLNQPSGSLQNDIMGTISYLKVDEYYFTCDMKRFQISQPLFNFVSNKTEIEQYLLQHNVKDTVKNITLLDTPRTPMTVWIEAEKEFYYITIQKNSDEAEHRFQLYSSVDMCEAYACRDATLIINEKMICTDTPIKCYNGYAEVPLSVVFESLGLIVDRDENKPITVTIGGKEYFLEIEKLSFHESGKEANNLLHVDGGSSFIYSTNDDIWIDSDTLRSVLSDLAINVSIDCDFENKTIAINTEDGLREPF